MYILNKQKNKTMNKKKEKINIDKIILDNGIENFKDEFKKSCEEINKKFGYVSKNDLDKIIEKCKKNNNILEQVKIKLIKNTNHLRHFFADKQIKDYSNRNVIYILVIGFYGDNLLFKFGLSEDIISREKQHRITFGKQAKMIFVANIDNNNFIEKEFKKFIISNNLQVKLIFDNKEQQELFITTPDFELFDAIEMMQNLVKNYKTDAEIEKDNMIENLINKNKILENSAEQEKTKQKEEKTKQMIIKKEIIIEKERTKQKEIDDKQKEREYNLKEFELKIKLEKIKNNNNVNNIVNNINVNEEEYNIEDINNKDKGDIYLQFLNECTEESTKHIKNTDLYENYINWFKNKNPNEIVPSNREFTLNIKKYKAFCHVNIDKQSVYGIKNLRLKIELEKCK
jgi:hypothetical protein